MEPLADTQSFGQAVVEAPAPAVRRIAFSIPAETVKRQFDAAYEKIKGRAVVKGFRVGHAPRALVERQYRAELREMALDEVMPEALQRTVTEHNLRVVGRPRYENVRLEADEPLTFTATVEVLPEFELPPYTRLPVKRVPIAEATDEEVNSVVEEYRRRLARFGPIESRPVEEGDFVVANVTEEVGGEKRTAEAQWIEVAKGVGLQGYAENIIGMKIGEKKTFALVGPSDHPDEAIAGKPITFEIEVLEIKQRILPDVDDELAREAGRGDTMLEMRSKIRQSIEGKRRQQARSKEIEQIVDHLVGKAAIEIPPSLLKAQTQRNIVDTVRTGLSLGIPRKTIDDSRDSIVAQASASSERQIKATLLMRRIAEKEGFVVQPDEVETFLRDLAARRDMDPATLRQHYEETERLDEIEDDLLHEKVLNFLLANAAYDSGTADGGT